VAGAAGIWCKDIDPAQIKQTGFVIDVNYIPLTDGICRD
jgi:hypothetical protein